MPTGKPKILKVFEFYVKFDDGHGTTTGRDVTVAASSKAKAEATLNDALGKGELAVDVHGAEINSEECLCSFSDGKIDRLTTPDGAELTER